MVKEGAAGVRRDQGQSRKVRRRGDGSDSRTVRTLAASMAMLGLFDAEHRNWSLDEMVPRLPEARSVCAEAVRASAASLSGYYGYARPDREPSLKASPGKPA